MVAWSWWAGSCNDQSHMVYSLSTAATACASFLVYKQASGRQKQSESQERLHDQLRMLQQSVTSAAMIVQLFAEEAMLPWKSLPGPHLLLVSSPLLPGTAGTRCPAGQYMAFRASLIMTMARSIHSVERPHTMPTSIFLSVYLHHAMHRLQLSTYHCLAFAKQWQSSQPKRL